MPIELFRIDDRLIHGQVVVGWGQPLDVGFIVLVDDEVATSEWEQELYRLGVPPGMSVHFETVAEAADRFARYNGERRVGILLTKDIETMRRLASSRAAASQHQSWRPALQRGPRAEAAVRLSEPRRRAGAP